MDYKITAGLVLYSGSPEIIVEAILSFLESMDGLHLTVLDNNSPDDVLDSVARLLGEKADEPISIINFDRLETELPSDSGSRVGKFGNRIRLLRTGENGGFGSGHNKILKHLPSADYHLILNPDAVLHPGSLEKIKNFMDSNQDICLSSPKILNPDGSLQPLNKRLPSLFDLFARRFLPGFIQNLGPIRKKMEHYIMMDCGYDRTMDVPFLSGAFLFFRYDVFKQIGGFDERFFMYFEDTDINRRAHQYGRGVFFPEATITHYWGRHSHKKLKYTLIFIQSTFQYFNKWGWRFY